MRVKEIIEQAVAPEEDVESDVRDLFEMANLYPDTTGLPMTVWVSPRGNARPDVRVKVNMTHGNQTNIANSAVVGVRPTPRVIAGQLSPADTQAVFQWIALNTDVLVAYWEGQIDTARMIQGLKPLPPIRRPGQPSTP
jgi:D-alanyl-D-alanine carboxypeptidase